MAKEPYRASNKKDHQKQVCLTLDWREKIEHFAMYLDWKKYEEAKAQVGHDKNPEVPDWQYQTDSALAFAHTFLPQPARNTFEDDAYYTPRNETTAFILTGRITHGDAKVRQIARKYKLPKLRDTIEEYLERELDGGEIRLIDCWDRVRLQLRSSVGSNDLSTPVPVMAVSPSDDSPYGLCNFVLVKNIPELNYVSFGGTPLRNIWTILC